MKKPIALLAAVVFLAQSAGAEEADTIRQYQFDRDGGGYRLVMREYRAPSPATTRSWFGSVPPR